MKRREMRSDVAGCCRCSSTKRLSPRQKPGQRYGDRSLNWRTGQSESHKMWEEVGEMMQKKMQFQINEIGEIETLYGFSDPFSVTGGGLLSHSSDSGDNEITALWTEAGRINKSKLISPAPKTQGNLFQGLSVVLRAEGAERLPKALIHRAIWQRWMLSVKWEKKGATWCQNRENRRFSSYVLRGTSGEIMRVRCRFLQQQLGVFVFSPQEAAADHHSAASNCTWQEENTDMTFKPLILKCLQFIWRCLRVFSSSTALNIKQVTVANTEVWVCFY